MNNIHYTTKVKKELYKTIMNETNEEKREALMEEHFLSVEELASWGKLQ